MGVKYKNVERIVNVVGLLSITAIVLIVSYWGYHKYADSQTKVLGNTDFNFEAEAKNANESMVYIHPSLILNASEKAIKKYFKKKEAEFYKFDNDIGTNANYPIDKGEAIIVYEEGEKPLLLIAKEDLTITTPAGSIYSENIDEYYLMVQIPKGSDMSFLDIENNIINDKEGKPLSLENITNEKGFSNAPSTEILELIQSTMSKKGGSRFVQ